MPIITLFSYVYIVCSTEDRHFQKWQQYFLSLTHQYFFNVHATLGTELSEVQNYNPQLLLYFLTTTYPSHLPHAQPTSLSLLLWRYSSLAGENSVYISI